jgi:uncharacterized protein YndB with AHSA1/START domain
MVRDETSVTINRPIEDVFAVLSNPETGPKWSSMAIEEKWTSPEPHGVGSTFRSAGKILGRRIEADHVVTVFEPSHRVAMKTESGPTAGRLLMTFERVEGGTKVVFDTEFEAGGLVKLAKPLWMKIGRRQWDRDLATLKGLMEAGRL